MVKKSCIIIKLKAEVTLLADGKNRSAQYFFLNVWALDFGIFRVAFS